MSANGPPRMKLESMVVHDAKRRLRLVMELLEQEWRRQQAHGAEQTPSQTRCFLMNIAALYARVSTTTQQHDETIASQLDALMTLCSGP